MIWHFPFKNRHAILELYGWNEKDGLQEIFYNSGGNYYKLYKIEKKISTAEEWNREVIRLDETGELDKAFNQLFNRSYYK